MGVLMASEQGAITGVDEGRAFQAALLLGRLRAAGVTSAEKPYLNRT